MVTVIIEVVRLGTGHEGRTTSGAVFFNEFRTVCARDRLMLMVVAAVVTPGSRRGRCRRAGRSPGFVFLALFPRKPLLVLQVLGSARPPSTWWML